MEPKQPYPNKQKTSNCILINYWFMPSMNYQSKEIILIGSGFGGLSAAIRLASAGHQVTIYEKRDKIRGRAYQYEVNGFKFDGGPTVITAPYMFDELFALGGRNREDYFELLPVDPFYRIFDENGRSYTYHRDLEKAKQEVAKISPEDVAGFERFVQSSVKIFEKYHPLTEKPFLKQKDNSLKEL